MGLGLPKGAGQAGQQCRLLCSDNPLCYVPLKSELFFSFFFGGWFVSSEAAYL